MSYRKLNAHLASRKVAALAVGMLLVSGGAVLAALVEGFRPSYATFVGGIVALFSIYAGVNVYQKRSDPISSKVAESINKNDG